MTQVGSEEVRTSRWTPRQRSSGSTRGTSGSTSMSLKWSDSFMKSQCESGRVKGSFSFNSRRTMNEDERPSKNYPQKLTTQRQKSFEHHLSSTLMRVKLVLIIISILNDTFWGLSGAQGVTMSICLSSTSTESLSFFPRSISGQCRNQKRDKLCQSACPYFQENHSFFIFLAQISNMFSQVREKKSLK